MNKGHYAELDDLVPAMIEASGFRVEDTAILSPGANGRGVDTRDGVAAGVRRDSRHVRRQQLGCDLRLHH